MITKTFDRSRATWIYDCDGHRAFVYKVGKKWMLRAGICEPGRIAPRPELVNDYNYRRLADNDAFNYLSGL